MSHPPVSRRGLLLLTGASALGAGCQGSGPTGSRRSATPSPVPPPTPKPPSPTPQATRYSPLAGEIVPNCKKAAADFIQTLTTRQPGQPPEAVVEAALTLARSPLSPDTVLRLAAPVLSEDISVGRILYPQMAGLLPLGPNAVRAAVMVVVEQSLTTRGGNRTTVSRVCEVLLNVQQGQWTVIGLASTGGQPLDRPAGLDSRAASALDNPLLELPDTCRWDVHAGRVSPELLAVLDRLAATKALSVSVLRTGHPINVFATSRRSDHNRGQAADVWRVAGRPIVSTGATGPAGAALRAAFSDKRVKQTGSPPGSDLDGRGRRRSFADPVHQDHLHIAVGTTTSTG